MAGGFSITVSATDRVTKTLDAINKRMAAFQAPIQRAQKSLGKFAQLSGLNRVGNAIGGITRQALGAYQALGQIVPVLGLITSAAGIASLYRMSGAWAEWGTQIRNAAARIGIGAGQLSAYQGAARLAGASSQAMTSGLQTLGQTMYDAIGGRAPDAIAMFNTLGIAFKDANGHARSVTTVLPEIADKIRAIKDPFSQARVATQLLGSAGEELLPFLRQGAAGMARYTEMARRYGAMSAEDAARADQLRMAHTGVSLALEGLSNRIECRLSPVLTPLLTQFSNWLATSPQVKHGIDMLATGVGELGTYLANVNWASVEQGMERWGGRIKWVVDELGGVKAVARDLMVLIAGTFALQMMAPWAGLVTSIGGVIAKLVAMKMASNAAAAAAEAAQMAAMSPGARAVALARAGMGGGGALATSAAVAAGAGIAATGGLLADQLYERSSDIPTNERIRAENGPVSRWAYDNISGIKRLSNALRGRPGDITTDRNLTPQARGLLDTIAGTESPGYNVMYGGQRFGDYSHHPGIGHTILNGPNAGKSSSAAGRYQFLESTWKEAANALGLQDFSPGSQDQAAWWLAQRDYGKRTGRNLTADLQSNNPAIRAGIGAALHDTWTSLPGGIEAGTNTGRFARQLDANTAREMRPNGPEMRLAGGNGRDGADGANGQMQVAVTVDHRNPPPGSSVRATASGQGVRTSAPTVARTGLGVSEV